jgi:MtrB/PioB family decaheme-associated outer membrane protein
MKHGRSSSAHANCLGSCVLLLAIICCPAVADDKPEKGDNDRHLVGHIEAGVGYQSDDSYWFGRYTGLTDKGPYFIGDLDLSYHKADNSEHSHLHGRRLGLDSRSLLFNFGEQGKHDLDLWYRELPNFVSDTVFTPYVESGDNQLVLPPSVNEDTLFRQFELGTKRRQVGGKLAFIPARYWQGEISLKTEDKDGIDDAAGLLGWSARNATVAILPKPVDYTTDDIGLSFGYARDKGFIKAAMQMSRFRNGNDSLGWDNPFPDAAVNSGARGQLALEPDNDFQQFSLSGGYRLPGNTQFSAAASSGTVTQDQPLLPYTVNPAIASEPLPRDSLDGKVRLNSLFLKLSSRPTGNWFFNGSYRYYDRDNQSPVATWNYVSNDSLPPGQGGLDDRDLSVQNTPYSYNRQQFKLDGRYRFSRKASLTLGYDLEDMQRDNAEVNETDEQGIWGKFKWKIHNRLDSWLKLARYSRDGSGYNPILDDDGYYVENPLLRKYNLADRERDEARLYLSWFATDKLNLSANGAWRDDDYSESYLGLTDASNRELTLQASLTPRENITSYLYYSWSVIDAEQAGREANPGTSGTLLDRFGADWTASTEDRMDTAGIGLQWQRLLPKLDAGLDLAYSTGVGETDVDGADAVPFDDIDTRLTTLKLYAQYNHSRQVSFRLRYWREKYRLTDWAMNDDVVIAYDSPTTLYLGQGSPDYDVDVIGLSMLYRF